MSRSSVIVLGICVGAAAVSFLITRAAQPQTSRGSDGSRSALLDWLNVSPVQREAIHNDDPQFDDESAALMAELRNRRHALAALLENQGATDQQVLEQVDRLAEIEAKLERRITEYVLRVRHHLTSEQQKKLLGLCARGIRGENRCRWCEDSEECRCKSGGGQRSN